MTSDANRGGWVGRSLRRVEDPALVTGQGRFTGDLPAAKWIRFVRSPVAAGRNVRVLAPEGVMLVTAAEITALRPIVPMLHKFKYAPIAQPILARDVVRFVGEPVAAVVADSREAAEDLAERTTVDIEETTPLVTTTAALAPGAPAVHAGRGPHQDREFRRRCRHRAPPRENRNPLAAPERVSDRAARRPGRL